MNENMLKVLVTDSYLDNTDKGISKFEFIYAQQTNNRVKNNKEISDEVNFITSSFKKKGIDVKVAGSFRRNNLYLDELTFLVVSNSKKGIIKKCQEIIDFENINSNRASRIIKVNNYYLFELFIFVTEKDYVPALIKYTGSSEFYKLYKAKVEEKGLFKINAETEQEVFNQLGIPYLQPELRECVDDLSIPYASFIIEKNESIKGNLIPFKNISKIGEYKDCEFIGIYVTSKELVQYGKGIITLIRSISIENLNIYIGIELSNLTEYDEKFHNDFDFVLTDFNVTDSRNVLSLSSIKKYVIVKSFGTTLSSPKRTILNKIDWIPLLKRLSSEKVIIAINCYDNINNLHPFLLNTFKKLGGNFILFNPENNDFSDGIGLLRKALVSKKSLIHNHYRLRKSMEDRNGNA